MIRNWIIAALLPLCAMAYQAGRMDGQRLCTADHAIATAKAAAATIAAAELASRKEAARLQAEAERDALAQTLEDQAYAQAAAGVCLSADRVRRLNSR